MIEYSVPELEELYNTIDKVIFKSPLYYYLVNNTTTIDVVKLFPKQRMWHLINNTNDIPLCPICNKQVKWDDAQPFKDQRYREFCSVSCSRKSVSVIEKKKQTDLLRSDEDKANSIQKRKNTNIEKYGVESAVTLSTIQEKRKQTVRERYGVDNVIQSIDCIGKRKQTNIERFGVEYPAQSDIIKNKYNQTMLDKYGCLPTQLKLPDGVLDKLSNRDWLFNEHITNNRKMSDIADELKIHQATILRYLKLHQIEIKYYSHSILENDLSDWIKSLGIVVINNTKAIITPKELDIYLPEYNIAIEFDGIYWHSELQGKQNNYHLNKTIECNNKEIRLIHIFENEWVLKSDIVKSRLLSILNKNNKLPARKCNIRQLSSLEYTEFFVTNHIQGSVISSICYGLFFDDECVAAMSFGISRFNKKCEYELLRFSNKLNTNVIGGASKLFKHFIKNHDVSSIVSYSDIRWNTGALYEKLGFKFQYNSKPNYFYFHANDHLTLYSRHQFQKHKLYDRLNMFDDELTGWDNMVNNGYNRIWDCGNSVWIWNR